MIENKTCKFTIISLYLRYSKKLIGYFYPGQAQNASLQTEDSFFIHSLHDSLYILQARHFFSLQQYDNGQEVSCLFSKGLFLKKLLNNIF